MVHLQHYADAMKYADRRCHPACCIWCEAPQWTALYCILTCSCGLQCQHHADSLHSFLPLHCQPKLPAAKVAHHLCAACSASSELVSRAVDTKHKQKRCSVDTLDSPLCSAQEHELH